MDLIEKLVLNQLKIPIFCALKKNIVNQNFVLSSTCQKCTHKCNGKLTKIDSSFSYCNKNFFQYRFDLNGTDYIAFGFILDSYKKKFSRKEKKDFSDFIISQEELIKTFNNVEQSFGNIKNLIETEKIQYLNIFHDILPTISLVLRNVESLISAFNGKSFEEKLDLVEKSDKKIFNLYKSVQFLSERVKLMPLISNPDSAKYGQREKCSIYKAIDKLQYMFNEKAKVKKVKIKLLGTSFNTLLVYESFTTLLFTLIDNAVKYSLDNQEVKIFVRDKNSGVEVEIESFGPIIEKSNQDLIFSKDFRGKNAKLFSSSGSGIGLYVAKSIADAHNTEIEFTSTKSGSLNGINSGKNIFKIFIQ